jgi:LacI family transcriptional regulator
VLPSICWYERGAADGDDAAFDVILPQPSPLEATTVSKTRQPAGPRRVILLIESSRAYGRGCLLGIGAYLRDHGPWEILHWERGPGDDLPGPARRWKSDGIITRIENEKTAKAVAKLGVPVVDLRGAHRPTNGAMLDTDPEACARLAAEHFLDRGFRHFAYCGYPGVNFSDQRCLHFVRHLEALGRKVAVLAPTGRRTGVKDSRIPESSGEGAEPQIDGWLAEQPRPLAVFACNDVRGRQVLAACTRIGLLVPEDVAVLGVDNDEVICSLALPPLSSIKPDTFQIGFEGAANLDALMNGASPPDRPILIPPQGIVVRRSSDVLALEDAELVIALRFIRDHACEGITIGQILAHVAISRATLERRFQRTLGRSPKAEIERVRLLRAKRLLAETPYKLHRVAQMIGYQTAAQFAIAFKRQTGLTPGQYRRDAQPADPLVP